MVKSQLEEFSDCLLERNQIEIPLEIDKGQRIVVKWRKHVTIKDGDVRNVDLVTELKNHEDGYWFKVHL